LRLAPGRHVIVIPFFDEEKRMDAPRLVALAKSRASISLLLVDDGSRDGTRARLHELAAATDGKAEVLGLDANGGKGEAVRRGLLQAMDHGAGIVAYADADLATPPAEVVRLVELLAEDGALDVVVASRVLMVGRHIERRAWRHYLGRAFATLAANILRTPFYDTQCGAKVLRATPAVRVALADPFVSRWAFDVELLGRLLVGVDDAPPVPLARMREVPLEEWIDVPGSKLHLGGMARALADLGRIEIALDRLRSARRRRLARGA
jgi:glycosyltransferase involved in cell wall biosynthesis